MALNEFGLTPESVRAHYFPSSDEWSADSNPSTTVVADMVNEEAGVLAGALNAEAIDAASISDTATPAYVQCRQVLREQVAIRVTRVKTGTDPELVKAWKSDVRAWYQGLADGGATFLGGGATAASSSDPDGPTSHISEYGLLTDDPRNMSSAVPLLRKDDQL